LGSRRGGRVVVRDGLAGDAPLSTVRYVRNARATSERRKRTTGSSQLVRRACTFGRLTTIARKRRIFALPFMRTPKAFCQSALSAKSPWTAPASNRSKTAASVRQWPGSPLRRRSSPPARPRRLPMPLTPRRVSWPSSISNGLRGPRCAPPPRGRARRCCRAGRLRRLRASRPACARNRWKRRVRAAQPRRGPCTIRGRRPR
jgi:hypothetical protein